MHIIVNIERLILDGVPMAAGTERIVERSIRHELARLLADPGLPSGLAGGVSARSLVASTDEPAAPHSAALGSQIGRAAYRGLGTAAEAK